MKERIKIRVVLVLMIFIVVLVGCGNKPNNDVREVIDVIMEKERQDEYEYSEDDYSFKVYYSELLDVYMAHAFIPYNGEPNRMDFLYSYQLKELDRNGSISQLSNILKEGNYEEVYRSGKFVE